MKLLFSRLSRDGLFCVGRTFLRDFKSHCVDWILITLLIYRLLRLLCGALLRRKVPHIALHSVRPSVCPSVPCPEVLLLSLRMCGIFLIVYITTVLWATHPTSVFDYRPASTLRMCGIFSFVYICGAGAPHTVTAISRTSLFILCM